MQPRRLLRNGGAYPRSSAACLPSSDTTKPPTLGFAPSGEAQVRVVGLGRRGSDKGGQQRTPPEVPGAGTVHWKVLGAGKTGTREESVPTGPCIPRAVPWAPPPSKLPSEENVGSRRSRSWRHLPLPSLQENPPRRRGRLRPTSSLPPSSFPSLPLAARPLLPPLPSFPHRVCEPLPLRLAGRLGHPLPKREAGAQAAAATRGCGGEQNPRPRGGPASGPGRRGLPLHPQPRAAGPGLAAGCRR